MCAMMGKEILPTFQEIVDETDYSKLKNCTIVIPTYNRPAYLRRILGYYNRTGIPLSVIVADSSPDKIKDLNREICEACLNLDIQYRGSYNSNLNPLHKVMDAVQRVSTPFVVLCADDDFIIPLGMLGAMEFLSVHPEYKMAQGKGMIFYSLDVIGEVQFGIPGMGIIIDDASAEKRLIRHDEHYSPTFYAVHETDFLQQIFSFTKDDGLIPEYGPDPIIGLSELYPTWLTSIYSRIGIISRLYTVRDRSSVRQWDIEKGCSIEHCDRIVPDLSGKQLGEKSNPDALLKESLIKHIRKQTGMDEKDVKEVVIQLIEGRRKRYQEGQKSDVKGGIIEFIRSILPHNRVGDWVRRRFHNWIRIRYYDNNNSLEYLLSRRLIDEQEYQDCCLVQESILEFEEYVKKDDNF
jgi:glycosyltransferase domain-containing protein